MHQLKKDNDWQALEKWAADELFGYRLAWFDALFRICGDGARGALTPHSHRPANGTVASTSANGASSPTFVRAPRITVRFYA